MKKTFLTFLTIFLIGCYSEELMQDTEPVEVVNTETSYRQHADSTYRHYISVTLENIMPEGVSGQIDYIIQLEGEVQWIGVLYYELEPFQTKTFSDMSPMTTMTLESEIISLIVQ